MTILANRTVSANADDRQHELAHRAILFMWNLPDDAAATLPLPAARPPCSCDDEDEEDRERRHDRDARPHTDEDAYWSGWTLGYSGVSADAPTGMSGHLRRAFRAGLEEGWQALEQADRLEWADKFESETRALMMAHEDLEAYFEEQELAYGRVARKAGA